MNPLLEKYDDYIRLVGCKVIYTLEDGTKIEFIYKRENFPHLLGLHKLQDLQLVQFWLDRTNYSVKLGTVMRRIEKETFTDAMVRSSVFFSKIEDRYNNFTYDNLTTLNYTDAIVDFNPTIMNSKLQSDYILFENRNGGYNHMGVAKDSAKGNRYVETFFHEQNGIYLTGQKIMKIKKYEFIDINGNTIVEDMFL